MIDVRATVAAATLAFSASPALAITTEVSDAYAGGGWVQNCPLGETVIGGGFDPQHPAEMVGAFGEPQDAFNELSFARFAATAYTRGDPAESFRIAAICGDLSERSVEVDGFAVPAGGIATDSVLCPLGTVAVGGAFGRGAGQASDASVAGSGPTFPSQILAPNLADRPDGENPAPGGWRTAFVSEGPAANGEAIAVCAAVDDVVTIVVSDTVQPGTTETASAFCPDGMDALGGGVDASDRSGLRVASTAPLLPGYPFAWTTFGIGAGTHGAPVGWRAALRNDGDAARAFKVAAICVPEPDAAACAALVALALVARRRA